MSEVQDYKVSFFNLKNDGDSAVVRFPYANEAQVDADKINVHQVKVKIKDVEKTKKIKCVRSYADPIDNCPLCATNNQSTTRMFVKVVYYTLQQDGTYQPQAAIWERPYSFADIIKGKMKDLSALFGSTDLSGHLFKITRHGATGDQLTKYDIELASKEIYKNELFPADFSGFNNFDVANSFICWTKSFEDLTEFVKTGKFPYNRPMQQEQQQTAVVTESVIAQPAVSTVQPQQVATRVVAVPAAEAPAQVVATMPSYPAPAINANPTVTVATAQPDITEQTVGRRYVY